MPREKNQSKPSKASSEPSLVATVQQSRFHTEATRSSSISSKDLDIRGLSLTIAKRTLLTDVELRLQYGIHYAVVGRNGVGKSTLLRAMGEKHIPGIPANLRILLLGQSGEDDGGSGEGETALENVVRSDDRRERAMKDAAVLTLALEDTADPFAAARAVRWLRHEKRIRELEEAKKAAGYQSGARGLKARKELREQEEGIRASQEILDQIEIDAETLAEETEDAVCMLNELETSLDAMNALGADSKARTLLRGLGFSTKRIEGPLTSLSGGWKTRCNLARTLFQPSDYLLLDEPTNFLDLAAMLWLQSYLQTLPSTVLVITHDREFADAVANELLVIRDNSLEHFIGNLTAYDTARRDQQIRMSRMKAAQERQKAHMTQTIQGNIRAAKASGDDKKLKQAASRQKKLDERMGLEVSTKGGRFKLNRDLGGFHLNRRDEIVVPEDDPSVKISIPKNPQPLRFPGVLVAFEAFGFVYSGTGTQVLKDVNIAIHPGARVGIVGLNGAGKSSLLAHIVEGMEPLGTRTGTITRHPKAEVAYFSQSVVEELHELGVRDRSVTALSLLLQTTEGKFTEQEARKLLGSLGLQGRTASDVPLSLLSGGQKVRLALARLIWSPPNLLVLDEVTTHLDSDTIVALAKELNAYEGAVLVVTHDRFFMRSVVEGVIPFEGEEEEEWNEERKGQVWLLEKGRLGVLKGGVGEYEKIAGKGVGKIGF